MFLKLRVLFTILSALCLAFALTAWAIWGPIWLAILGLGALLFFLLMRIFKQAQETQEQREAESNKFFTNGAASPSTPSSPDDTNENA